MLSTTTVPARCHPRNNRSRIKGLELLNSNTDSNGWEPYVIGNVRELQGNKTRECVRKCARTEIQREKFPLKPCNLVYSFEAFSVILRGLQ